MKKILIIQCAFLCALMLAAGCSTSRTASYRSMDNNGTTASAYANTGQGGGDASGQTSTISEGASGQTITTNTTGNITTGGTATTETMDQAEVALHKEEMVVGKRTVSNGGVLVRKVVQSENASVPVSLRREEYTVERIPAGDARAQGLNQAGDRVFQNQEIFIPLLREEAVAGKRALLVETVKVGKRVVSAQENISRPVRTEDIEVARNQGNAAGQGGAAAAGQSSQITSQTTAPGTTTTSVPTGSDTLALAREELVVGKRNVSNGGVVLRKIVRTDTANQTLDLRREEFAMDRNPANNQPVDNADFREQEIRVDLNREEPVVSTRNFVTEIVRIHKTIQTDNQTVTGTVRQERVEVVQNTSGTSTNQGTASTITTTDMTTGQGGTGMAGQSGTSTLRETSRTTRGATNTVTRSRNTVRPSHPIPPPKAGEVMQFQDFTGAAPTDHLP